MPDGWLDVDLSSGLNPEHLWPDCEFSFINLSKPTEPFSTVYRSKNNLLENRDSLGVLKEDGNEKL